MRIVVDDNCTHAEGICDHIALFSQVMDCFYLIFYYLNYIVLFEY